MSVVPVVINGVIHPKKKSSGETPQSEPVVITGYAHIAGLGVGGGPIIPEQPPGGGQPGVPTFPIWGPPGSEFPGIPGYPPVAGHPLPEPPDPVDPEHPLDPGWEPKVAWTPTTGWIVVLVPKDETLVPTPSSRRR